MPATRQNFQTHSERYRAHPLAIDPEHHLAMGQGRVRGRTNGVVHLSRVFLEYDISLFEIIVGIGILLPAASLEQQKTETEENRQFHTFIMNRHASGWRDVCAAKPRSARWESRRFGCSPGLGKTCLSLGKSRAPPSPELPAGSVSF